MFGGAIGVSVSEEVSHEPGQLLGSIFSSSPDAIVVIDELGTIVLSNRSVNQLFGYFPEELVGESVELLLPAARRDRHAAHLAGYFADPRPRLMGAGIELSGLHRDGSEFPVDVALAPVELRGSRLAAAFVRDARERQRGVDRLHAVHEITERLLAGATVRGILPLVAERARVLAGADAVWVVTPSEEGDLEISSTSGAAAEDLLGQHLSASSSRSAGVMERRVAEQFDDLSSTTNVPSGLESKDLGPGLYVPIVSEGRCDGVLVLARRRGREGFAPIDVAFAELFAAAASTAFEMSDVRDELARLEIVSEEERIARDLHDTVIQQLFATGMSLQAALGSASGQTAQRIDAAIEDLDRVIREIRNTIFRLPARQSAGTGMRDELMRIGEKVSEELGFVPRIAFVGAIDAAVTPELRAQLLQVASEALSNVARHAQANRVEMVLSVEDGWLELSVVDDGVGLPPAPSAGMGLRNLRTRAENLGGTFVASPNRPTGTVATWRVPL